MRITNISSKFHEIRKMNIQIKLIRANGLQAGHNSYN